MKKSKIKKRIEKAIFPHKLCRVYFKYDIYYRYYYPLEVGEDLFLCAEEDDFILNGYTIRRFKDVTKVEWKKDKCSEINEKEGILDDLTCPEINMFNWKSVLISLQKMGKNIIVEKEDLDKKECYFAIGRIIKVKNKKVRFREFDADGIWQDDLLDIPFSQITSVTFNSRYVEVFSKYLSEPDK